MGCVRWIIARVKEEKEEELPLASLELQVKTAEAVAQSTEAAALATQSVADMTAWRIAVLLRDTLRVKLDAARLAHASAAAAVPVKSRRPALIEVATYAMGVGLAFDSPVAYCCGGLLVLVAGLVGLFRWVAKAVGRAQPATSPQPSPPARPWYRQKRFLCFVLIVVAIRESKMQYSCASRSLQRQWEREQDPYLFRNGSSIALWSTDWQGGYDEEDPMWDCPPYGWKSGDPTPGDNWDLGDPLPKREFTRHAKPVKRAKRAKRAKQARKSKL